MVTSLASGVLGLAGLAALALSLVLALAFAIPLEILLWFRQVV